MVSVKNCEDKGNSRYGDGLWPKTMYNVQKAHQNKSKGSVQSQKERKNPLGLYLLAHKVHTVPLTWEGAFSLLLKV